MPKKLLLFLLLILLSFNNLKVFATTKRLIDFNNTSDLTNYFNSDGSPSFSGDAHGGLRLSGSVQTILGPEDIWTSKSGYITTGSGDAFKITGYYYNLDNFGYGSMGFTNTDVSTGDGLGSPSTGIGIVFHGGGGYFVNNGVYEEVLYPPDLDDNQWYYFEMIAQNTGSNHFELILRIYKADELGTLLSFKTLQSFEVVNSDLASAAKLYSYFGTADARFTNIDNIEVELSGGATFEENGKPIVTSTTISNITTSTADAGGEVTSEMGASVSAKGVCYSTNPNPSISDTCTSDGSGQGSFNSNLTNLNPGTTYFYRAYATNNNGTSYGAESTFTTIGNQTKKVFSKPKCSNSKPPKPNWMSLKPSKIGNKGGMMLTWSQEGADKISILIDNGTGKFPYVISKTKNDGKEFLAGVIQKQKVKIIAHNGCRNGDTSKPISK